MGVKQKKQTEVDEVFLNQLPVAVMLFDDKGIYFLNKRAAAILGISQKKLIESKKVTVFDFIEKENFAKIKKRIALILKGEEVPAIEIQVRNCKGKTLWIETRGNLTRFKNKNVVQSTFFEISERHDRSVELEAAKNLLKKISANSKEVIFDWGFYPNSRINFISEAAQSLLEYTPEELYKNPLILKAHLHKENQKYLMHPGKEFPGLLKDRKERKSLIGYRVESGQIRHLEVSLNPVYDSKKVLTGVVGSLRDATEQVETQKLLIATKEKFDLITNNGNDIIAFYTFLPEEKYLYVSPNIKKILGYSPQELLDDNMFFNKRVIGTKDYFLNTDKQLINIQKKNLVKNCYYIFRILKNNKEEIWLECNYFPITNAKGKVSFFLNILRDVTEQREKQIEIQNQYINYQNLLDNSPVAYIIHQHGVCLYCNNALLKLLKLKNKNEILGKFTVDFFHEDDRKRAIERLGDIYKHKNLSKFYNYHVNDSEGNAIEVEIKSLLIKFNNVDCVLALINNLSDKRQRRLDKLKTEITESTNKKLQNEIKERREVEKNLIEKTAHLSSIFESSTHLIWTVNRKYEVTSFNQNFADVVKIQHNINIKPGYKIDEHLKRNRDQYIDFWYPRYAETFEGKKLEFEKEDMNQRRVYRKVFLNPIFNEKNEVTEINCIAHDVTDSKIYEQKLLNQTGKLVAIFDSSHHYIWTISHEGKLTSFNKNYYDLITSLYNTEPYLGLVLNRGVLSNDKEYTEVLNHHYKIAFSGQATNFEIETLDKNYKKIYLEIFLNPIYENETVGEVSGIAHNITDKKYVQQRMEQSLKEKEILLKEVHHRVKNNMQVVSSILNLQSSYVSDEYALTLLKESQNRIKTMAYIHESLYQNKSFTSVNFSEYVQTLVNNIIQSYSSSKEKIILEVNVEKITLSLDSSIPVGLIINELVTNSIKHGFPGSRRGKITLNLKCENNFVFLELKDDGVGFASDIDFENSHSLGLQLVNTLIEQIDGRFIFRSSKDAGAEVLITFKM
ncbi:MAG: PAS domain S-box protein [Bacteroidota bacterium]